jgi:hypothetical protein
VLLDIENNALWSDKIIISVKEGEENQSLISTPTIVIATVSELIDSADPKEVYIWVLY